MSLDRYKIDKVIGKGSYGEVSLVKHKKDKKQYVMKKVDLSKASDKERKAAEQEAKLLSQLRHPNIVSYRESFQDDQGFLYIVMNFCEGGDLYTKLKSQVKECQMLKETQVVEWFVQITMALQYMHERHVLHRDLKTQNIFLTKSNIIKVGDLGIARVLESASDMASTLIGTPYYMSPELFTNKPYNHKSDVWALGCCVYEMCTLRHAFNAKDMSSLVYKILKGKFPPLPSNYSPDLCSIVHSMLEQDPQKRPSAQRLLRHNYIKKQIALFLEGTKNRQKKKTGSKERIPSAKSRETQSQSSKSDSGNSGSGLEGSIATASAIDCIIEEEKLPKQARNNKERSFTDSSSSSSGYSEKGQTEVNVEKSKGKNAIELKQREMIKKQLSERKRSASEKSSNASVSKQKVAEKLVEDIEEKRPLPVVAKARTPRAEESARPLPRPPKGNSLAEDLPPSRSPRARRRYKVSSSCLAARSQYAEDEEEEDDINSEASQKSVSVVDSTPVSVLSARERRRLKQKETRDKSALATPPSVNILPSPIEVMAAKVKRSQEGVVSGSPKQASVNDVPRRQEMAEGLDVVDGGRPICREGSRPSIADSAELISDSDSELEELDLEETSTPYQKKPRKQSDVTSLISVLDSTLKLSDISVDRESPDAEQERDEGDKEPLDVPFAGGSPTVSGRLRDRIDRLRSECVRGIGEDLLIEAYSIIDNQPEDFVEDALVRLMGRENFEQYGGHIWQLKFCESFKRS